MNLYGFIECWRYHLLFSLRIYSPKVQHFWRCRQLICQPLQTMNWIAFRHHSQIVQLRFHCQHHLLSHRCQFHCRHLSRRFHRSARKTISIIIIFLKRQLILTIILIYYKSNICRSFKFHANKTNISF